MNLSKLIHEVWKDGRIRELRLRKDEVKILVEVLIDHIGRGLIKYGVVKLKNLFTLEVRKAKGRRIKNPQTGKHMYSRDYFKIGVKPSKRIKDELNKSNK
ncbi:hypothetical protein J41TS2_17750 [Bacillus sonorensis]|uniref:HU family DNA-binding protein n=1 Tax=Bacillus sonorensis TaxID=119858 RepID=UPI001B1AD3D9|nr:HU family DNA-binding protein [Bacillus sonorensis]GIN66354.1 hypothetical protein J41TS2_17750 [Bacillus sonorensis]